MQFTLLYSVEGTVEAHRRLYKNNQTGLFFTVSLM